MKPGTTLGRPVSREEPTFFVTLKRFPEGFRRPEKTGVYALWQVADHLRKHNKTTPREKMLLLSRYDVSEQNLQGIDLNNADLGHVDFTGCNLRYANFEGADLTGAIMKNADLTGARITPEQLEQTKGQPEKGPAGSRVTAEKIGVLRRAGNRVLFGRANKLGRR